MANTENFISKWLMESTGKEEKMAQKFVRDLCGKKLYHKAALEDLYKVHSPKTAIKPGEGRQAKGYQETPVDQAAKTYAVLGTAF